MQSKSLSKTVTSVTVFFISIAALSATSFNVFAKSATKAELKALEARIQHLEELNETRNKVQADISYQLSELQREVRALTGQVEDNTFKLKQIQERQRDLYRDIETRLSGMATQPAQNNSTIKPTPKTTSGAKTTPNTNPEKTNIDDSGNARREFEAAFALVRNKNYGAAITAFDEFLTKHPNSSYSANARYWMGQVYLVQNNLQDAEKQFSLLVTEFPDSSKSAAAKLKLADIYLKQEKWQEAKTHYSDVASNHTGAQQQLARKGLEKIKQAGH